MLDFACTLLWVRIQFNFHILWTHYANCRMTKRKLTEQEEKIIFVQKFSHRFHVWHYSSRSPIISPLPSECATCSTQSEVQKVIHTCTQFIVVVKETFLFKKRPYLYLPTRAAVDFRLQTHFQVDRCFILVKLSLMVCIDFKILKSKSTKPKVYYLAFSFALSLGFLFWFSVFLIIFRILIQR